MDYNLFLQYLQSLNNKFVFLGIGLILGFVSAILYKKELKLRARKKTLLKVVLSLVSALLLGLHLFAPQVSLDYIAVALLIVAIFPWLLPFIESVEWAKGKVKFAKESSRVQRNLEDVGLISDEVGADYEKYSFQTIEERDPNLALAGLRIEIEKRLRKIAEEKGLPGRGGAGQLLRQLVSNEILTKRQESVLKDLLGILNQAVHEPELDIDAADWALDIGPKIVKSLEAKLED